MEIIMPETLFHAIILVNIALVVALTIALFVKARQYSSTTFIFLILLLWTIPLIGVLAVPILMITGRTKQYGK